MISGILRARSGGVPVQAEPNPERIFIGYGAIAQLGERLHGMQEVDGSIPSGSTNKINKL
jgi:hypothetical protein